MREKKNPLKNFFFAMVKLNPNAAGQKRAQIKKIEMIRKVEKEKLALGKKNINHLKEY